jgi:protocadherin Fat 4
MRINVLSSSLTCVIIVLIFFLLFTQVKVKILDRNDNRPMWPSAPIEYKISEEIPIGSLVATLKATDPDLDSTLTYTVIGENDSSSSPLLLDAYTGNVRVRKPIDRETSPRHVLPVRVSDGVHHSDTTVVFIVSTMKLL